MKMRLDLFVVLAFGLILSVANPTVGLATSPYAQQVVDLTNQERAAQGLPPLIIHHLLENAAEAHSRDLGDSGICQHDSSDGTDWVVRLQRTGYTPFAGIGENVACGQPTPQQVVEAWMNSSGHRENILGNFQHIGVGYYSRTGTPFTHYWTMDLGLPTTGTPLPQPPSPPGPDPDPDPDDQRGLLYAV